MIRYVLVMGGTEPALDDGVQVLFALCFLLGELCACLCERCKRKEAATLLSLSFQFQGHTTREVK